MGLRVHTQEVEADFVGNPVEISEREQFRVAPAPVREIMLDAGTRDDGALGFRLVLRMTDEQFDQLIAMRNLEAA